MTMNFYELISELSKNGDSQFTVRIDAASQTFFSKFVVEVISDSFVSAHFLVDELGNMEHLDPSDSDDSDAVQLILEC